VLPYTEQLRYVISFVRRWMAKRRLTNKRRRAGIIPPLDHDTNTSPTTNDGKVNEATATTVSKSSQGDGLPPLYLPKFSSAFQHFCIHAGGRGVLDAIQVHHCSSLVI
jgi:hypothetical protein